MVYIGNVGPTVGVPLYGTQDEVTEVQIEFHQRLRESEGLSQRWHDRALVYYRTYGGNPWTQDDAEWMDDTERPVVTFNYTMSAVHTLVGNQLTNRREIQFKGVADFEDEQIAEWYTNIVRTHWMQGDGHRCEGISYQDMLITGRGFAHVYMDETQVPFKLRIEPVSPMEMFVDPWAHLQNLTDAKYFIRCKRWHLADAIASYPDKEKELESLSKPVGRRMYPKIMDMSRQGRWRQVSPWTNEDTISIYEYQYRQLEPHVYFRVPFRVDPETLENKGPLEIPGLDKKLMPGTRAYVTAKQFKAVKRAMKDDPFTSGVLQPFNFAKDVYYRCVLAGNQNDKNIILVEPTVIESECFTYAAVTGFMLRLPDEGRVEHTGLVSQCHQPQLWSSRILSGAVEMLSRGSKGGGFAEMDAFEDPEEFLDRSAAPGAWHMTTPGAVQNGKIQERSPAAYPQGMEQMFRLANSAIPQVTGVSEWLSGNSTRERSDKLISNLQSQGMTQLAPIIDPMDQFRTEVGRILAQFIYLYMVKEDINKGLGKQEVENMTFIKAPNQETGAEEQQPVPFMDEELGIQRAKTAADWMKEKDPSDFDIVVDLGTATATQKQQTWEVMGQGILQAFREGGVPMEVLAPEMIRNMPGMPVAKAEAMAERVELQMSGNEKQMAMETLANMEPQEKMEIAQQIMSELQSMQEQQAPAEGQPPGGPQQGPPQPEGAMPQ